MSDWPQDELAVPTAEDALASALDRERLRNGRLLNLVRLVGVTLFLAVVLWKDVASAEAPSREYRLLLAGYWLLSLGFFAGGWFSDRFTRLSNLVIPFVDVPLLFLIQLGELRSSAVPRAVADFTLGLYVLLVMLATLALRAWETLVAAAAALFLELLLQVRAGEPALGRIGGALLIGLAAGICEYARRRRVEMVKLVCAEQLSRERLGRYFSPQVAEHIQKKADDLAAGQDCVVTVLFADLCGFTALSEQLGSARTVALLNEFHAQMVEGVFAHGGTLDKYTGDGLMAYFGAPLAQPDHAARAVRCALGMQQRLALLNARRLERGEPALGMGIGIHSGSVVVGSIGAPHRREFTVVGDTVNLASRLEQVAKLLNEGIIISEETRRDLGEEFAVKSLEAVSVKGKLAPVRICAPLPSPPDSGRISHGETIAIAGAGGRGVG